MSDKNSKAATNKPTSSGESGESSDSTAGMSMNYLRRYLAEKLGFYDDEKVDSEKIKILDDISVDGIIDYVKNKNCKNIITMAGAGISTSAGIPDFRSPGSGLYDNLMKYEIPSPTAIFDIDFFMEDPKPFFRLAKDLYPGYFKPTVCHYFIRMLLEKGLLLRHYTQNIDTLERVAEIPDEMLVEAHGTFHTGHCLECKEEYTQNWMKEKIFNDEIPICEKCPGVVKPNIVFFGESMPDKFYDNVVDDFKKCDLLIILGSSLKVQPFASLVDRVPNNVPRLLINRQKAGHRTGIMAMLGVGGGLQFDCEDNTRDVVWVGDCDEGCQMLADRLGWGDALKELCEKEHKRIDEESKTTLEKEEKHTSGDKSDQSPKL